MENITGQLLRETRIKKGLLIREVAARIEIDPSLLSKIERGDKRPTKDNIDKLSRVLDCDREEIITSYLSDRIVDYIIDEDVAIKALDLARDRINKAKK